MKTFLIDDIAQNEFEDAAVWYEHRSPGLGDEFVAEVDRVLSRIENQVEFATSPIGRYAGFVVRREFVQRFPYLVMFVETNDARRVIMIRRNDCDPALWLARIAR